MTHNEKSSEPARPHPNSPTAATVVPPTLISTTLESSLKALGVLHNEESAQDILKVEEVLKTAVRSAQATTTQLANRLIASGGKRLRPYLLCLIFRALRAQSKNGTPALRGDDEDLHHLAAVSELVHTATLFHDDVLDHSSTRRGLPSAHILHGNKTAVLVGDFVYAEAFYVLMERGLLEPSRELARTVKMIVDGELLQHEVAQNRSLAWNEYNAVANAKTGTLFGWCTGTGAWLAGSPHFEAAKQFGNILGYAFQMADDLIDTFEIDVATASDSDLISWIDTAPPLPLVLAAQSNPSVNAWWKAAILATTREEQIALVQKLQDAAKNPLVVAESLKRVDEALEKATQFLTTLGLENDMSWTVETIAERARQGAELSQALGIEKKNHGLA